MTLNQAIILTDDDVRNKTGLENTKSIISDCFHALRLCGDNESVAFSAVYDNYYQLKNTFTYEIISVIFSSVINIFNNNSIEY